MRIYFSPESGETFVADWMAIKTEYVTGTISQRKLAEKYGVSYSRLAKVAAAEKWSNLRSEQRIKTEAKANQKAVEKTADSLSDTAAIKARLDRKFWGLIEQAAEELTVTGPIDPADLRRVVQCYVDMRGLPEDMQSNLDQHNALMEALKEVTGHET